MDGALNRDGVPYDSAERLDEFAIARVTGISSTSSPYYELIHTAVTDRIGGLRRGTLDVLWPKGRPEESYGPTVGGTYFVIGELPRAGRPVNPGDLDSTVPDLFADEHEVSGMFLRTSRTTLIRDSDRKSMIADNLVPCLQVSDPVDVFRAAWCLNATGYPGGGCTTNLDGRDLPPLGSRMLGALGSMTPAGRALTLSILAGWHVDGIEAQYLEDLYEAGVTKE
ncbi:MAG TPA: hypothetical protein VFT74_17165, partial [Isosphaeraceae bacterium]|nr:hypothetical protein [Isosphaeraceae bacterium]